ncbi:MAG: DUF4349 domain-containing protein [Lachnospiraceae bacterium]|nr:DUF4349 domain-containing protein [Lachnospiraceae bacterium]
MKRKWTKLLLMLAMIASLLTGCGTSGNSSISMTTDTAAPAANNSAPQEYYSGGVAYDMAAVTTEEIAESEGGEVANQTQDETLRPDGVTLLEEKLVYHCNLEIETLDYPATMTSVKETITKYGGIIQSESESDSGYNWYYENYRKTSGTMHNYLEVRIPSKNYNNFLAELDGVGKVISKSTSVDNISQQYYDTTAQIEALQIQEKNLLAMLEKCETIEDMITVEQRLSEVQYQLNNLQTTRRYMDMDVAYSYVNINISEVMEYRQESEPVRRNTFADRLKNTLMSTGRGFLAFLEGLLFLVIRLSPYIVIAAVICLIFLKGRMKHFMENRKIKKEARLAQKALRGQNGMPQPMAPQNQNGGWQVPPTEWMQPDGQYPVSKVSPTAQVSGEMMQGAQQPQQKMPQNQQMDSEN